MNNIKQKLKNSWSWIKTNIKKTLIFIGILGVASAATLIANPQISDVALENMQAKYEESDIKDKYEMKGASLVHRKIKNPELTKNGKPKDEIEITIGEENEGKFMPNIKIKRWDEVWFKIKPRLDGIDIDDMELEFDDNKIKFKTPEMEIEFEDFEEEFKFIWYLNSKPDSNIVEFDIESDGVDFYYQPELTQKYQNGYSGEFQTEIVVSETQVKDLDGDVLVEGPEMIMGSYAVYHNGNPTNWTDGKLYRVGKVGHIYRPRLKDSNGWEVWGDLHIENGIYEITIPEDFYDNAVYPIRSNDTFGYTRIGAILINTSTDRIRGFYPVNLPTGGTLDSFTFYSKSGSNSAGPMKVGVYDFGTTIGGTGNSDSDFIAETAQISSPTENDWNTYDFTTSPTLNAGTDYVPVLYFEGSTLADDVGDAGDGVAENINYTSPGTFPDPADLDNDTNDNYSMYATYTADAPPADPCAYSGTGNWEVNYSDNCYITSEVYVVGECRFINDGSGSFGISNTGRVSCSDIRGNAGFFLQGAVGARLYTR